MITNEAGAVTDTFAYGPFGEGWGHTGSTNTPFQFNGKNGVTTDPNGLLSMRARIYHPLLRRFLTQDTLLGTITPDIALNRCAFANGNPVSLMDPFGLYLQDDTYCPTSRRNGTRSEAAGRGSTVRASPQRRRPKAKSPVITTGATQAVFTRFTRIWSAVS